MACSAVLIPNGNAMPAPLPPSEKRSVTGSLSREYCAFAFSFRVTRFDRVRTATACTLTLVKIFSEKPVKARAPSMPTPRLTTADRACPCRWSECDQDAPSRTARDL